VTHLRVEFGTCRLAENCCDFDDGLEAYRVEVLCPAGMVTTWGQLLEQDAWLVLPTRFVRERDAYRAMKALIDAGFDNADSIRRSVAGGWGEIRRIMAEALAW